MGWGLRKDLGVKAAIMQPYFLPYLGYFQLISAVDVFVVYDNIQYTKKGWINRNRLLRNGADHVFTIPLKKDSDYLNVRDREISTDFRPDKLLNQIIEAYRKAPHFEAVYPLVKSIITFEERNLFQYIENSIKEVCRQIGIFTPIVISSAINADHSLKSQERVIAISNAVGASEYINSIGGITLYNGAQFRAAGIELSFLKCNSSPYKQYTEPFVPALSILDVMMFNTTEEIRTMLQQYEVLDASDSAAFAATSSV